MKVDSELYSTQVELLQYKVALDIVYIPLYLSKDRLILAQGEGSGQVKERVLKSANTRFITKFIFKEVIYRYRVFLKLVTDRGPKNNNAIISELLSIYRIRYIITSAFNP